MELTKKEMANMRNNSEKLSALKERVDVVAAFCETTEEIDSDGNKKEVVKGYLKTANGKYYGTISPTAIRSIETVIDCLEDGEKVAVEVVTRKSNAGREFISLTLF